MGTAPLVALAVALLIGVVLAPMVLTVLGARQRRTSWPRAVVSGLFFPVTWAVWYRADAS